jgi:hypothetical protein
MLLEYPSAYYIIGFFKSPQYRIGVCSWPEKRLIGFSVLSDSRSQFNFFATDFGFAILDYDANRN